MTDRIKEILDGLTTEEKALLVTGVGNDFIRGIPKLGIPDKQVRDSSHGVRLPKEKNTALFPCVTSLASSWDVENAELMGGALADECINQGVTVLLSPGINIKRYILCGRNFEYMSEDPILAGEIAAGYVRGLQNKGVGGCIKHLACNNQETDRLEISAEVDERTLREIYLKPFEVAVKKSAPYSIMCSYNKINGIWASENKFLWDVVKNEWGYEGIVVSDWGAVVDICKSLTSGLDLEMPENKNAVEQILRGLEAGTLTMERLNDAAGRVLNFILKPLPTAKEAYDRHAQHQRVRKIAADGIVLLKNDRDLLPLTPEKYKKITVVGGYATKPVITGQGSAEVYPKDEFIDSPLEEIKKLLPECEIEYLEYYNKGNFPSTMLFTEKYRMMEKIKDSDAVVIFAGSMESEDTEDSDRRYGGVNQHQELFIKAAINANKNTIVVLQSGSGMVLENWHAYAPAIVEMWHGGESAGGAIADVLTGRVNPSGKLAETFPTRLRSDLEFPGDGLKVAYKEGLDVGYRYYDKHPGEVAFPFGHGLSYTSFEYSDLKCHLTTEGVDLSFAVKNVGDCFGKEVYQIYISDPVSSVTKPEKELKAFGKVSLEAGEEKRVSATIPLSELAYYNIMLRDWVVEDGKYVISVGASAQDIRLRASVSVSDATPYTLWREDFGDNVFIGGADAIG